MPTKNPQEPFTRLSISEARVLVESGAAQIIDVREPREYEAGHIAGARLLPLSRVAREAATLDDATPILFICSDRQRSSLAAEYAAAAGKSNLFVMDGGTEGWVISGLTLER